MPDRQIKSQSAIRMGKQQAVCVRDAHKHYGSKKNPVVILNGLNMTVPKGTIYGLLGASGCGKTTLLSCIVGRKRLNSGKIWVLGGTPGSRGSGVPGPRIGYMPQEIALFPGFTIREVLIFFAWINNIEKQRASGRIDFLVDLLKLPNADQAVDTLSGGQQRRVSLAAALVHEPELLILDEPTVGVDPLLRKNIWDHLVEITETKNTTIIITTHYIDETRQAHLIGLMRGGYFLAEESPERLLTKFGVETLEDVFLKLSLMQDMGKKSRSSAPRFMSTTHGGELVPVDDVDSHSQDLQEVSVELEQNTPKDTVIPPQETPPSKFSNYLPTLKGNHLRALIWKYYIWLTRNLMGLLFLIGLPFMQISLFCVCIGHSPFDLPVAVINYESNNSLNCGDPLRCNSTLLSCNYLGYLEEQALRLKYYDSEEDARNSVLKGKTHAFILFKYNYSLALRARIKSWRRSRSWDIEASDVEVFRDVSSISIANYIKMYLYQNFKMFIGDYLETCGINRKALSLPISIENPVYGLNDPNFTDFATPGIILTIIFFLAIALTAGAMLIERTGGILERSLVCGITEVEILISHIVCQFLIMVVQAIVLMICAFAWFGMTEEGSLALVVLITLLAGFCGMCFGFTISCVCDSERTATYMAMGSLLPMMLLSGIVWPLEGMHHFLKLLAFGLPLTKATESLRSVLQRGWRFSNKVVYTGFISITTWIVIFLTISLLFLKFKKG